MQESLWNGIVRTFAIPIDLDDAPAIDAIQQFKGLDAAGHRLFVRRVEARFAPEYTCAPSLRPTTGGRWNLRVTAISSGFIHTDFAESMTDPKVKAQTIAARDSMAIPPDAIAGAVAFAIEQPSAVDVNEIVVRPTAPGELPTAHLNGSRGLFWL